MSIQFKTLVDMEFSCVYCTKHFSRKDNLARHINTCKTKYDINALRKQIEKQYIQLINVNKLLIKKDELINELNNKLTHVNDEIEQKPITTISADVVTNDNYIYIIQEREFIKTKEQIYKIGKTTKGPTKRFKQYSKGSVLLFLAKVPNATTYEKKIKQKLNKSFKQRTDIGYEYYEVEYNKLYKKVTGIIKTLDNNP